MSIKNSFLFGLSLVNEIMSEFRDPGGFVSFSYENMYGFVPDNYKKENLYNMVYELKKKGEIISEDRSFRITPKGKNLISDYCPKMRFFNKPWDGKWRIVGFDVEEKQRNLRDKFRKHIYRHGFRMVQKSLYVSPLPLEKEVEKLLILNKKILQNTYIFVSNDFFMENKRDLINKIFCLETLNGRYRFLLGRLKRKSKEDRRKLFREFIKISWDDPFLPKELLPKNFLRVDVIKELKKRSYWG